MLHHTGPGSEPGQPLKSFKSCVHLSFFSGRTPHQTGNGLEPGQRLHEVVEVVEVMSSIELCSVVSALGPVLIAALCLLISTSVMAASGSLEPFEPILGYLYCCPDCTQSEIVCAHNQASPLHDCDNCKRPRNMVLVGSFSNDEELQEIQNLCASYVIDMQETQAASMQVQQVPVDDYSGVGAPDEGSGTPDAGKDGGKDGGLHTKEKVVAGKEFKRVS